MGALDSHNTQIIDVTPSLSSTGIMDSLEMVFYLLPS